MQGLGLRGLGDKGLGFRVSGLGFRAWGLGLRAYIGGPEQMDKCFWMGVGDTNIYIYVIYIYICIYIYTYLHTYVHTYIHTDRYDLNYTYIPNPKP